MKLRMGKGVIVVLSFLLSICLVGSGFAAAKDEQKAEPAKKDEAKKDVKKEAGKKEAAKPVDLNGASQKDLEGLKGVGAAKAKKIIANRPYKSVDELSKAGFSKKQIDGLKPQVVVGAAPAAAPKAEAKPAAPAKAPEKAAAPAKEEKPAKDAKK